MCGIYLSLSARSHVTPSDRTRELLRRRGPDSARELRLQLDCAGNSTYVTCYSTVLALRGQQTVTQPIVTSDFEQSNAKDDFLCWNGEAWKLAGKPVLGNDSTQVFSLLQNAFRSSSSEKILLEQTISNTLASITGPYAFAYYDQASSVLFYGRDPLGRRALMYRFDDEGSFVLASVADASEPDWQEVEADGIYAVRIRDSSSEERFTTWHIPYAQSPTDLASDRSSSVNGSFLQQPPLYSMSPSVQRLELLLRESLQARVSNIPKHSAQRTLASGVPCSLASVLFSGGIDCTVLARISHDILDSSEPIDLLNVAFENPRIHRRPKEIALEDFSPYELCPDRITGRSSYDELQRVCPDRQWRFVAINVPYEEFSTHRKEVIDLIHPHNTEMDLSIASALYFAARGSGLLSTVNQPPTPYVTDSRILLSGLGADELFGGYTRHATAFSRNGFGGLFEELNLDIGRLGKRNLGRDDRVLSNWARETRFPFLDEDLVHWAVNAPVRERCGFGEQIEQSFDGSELLEPGKKVLRCLAWKLGMNDVAREKKRAVSVDC